jgi:hypothetical protein
MICPLFVTIDFSPNITLPIHAQAVFTQSTTVQTALTSQTGSACQSPSLADQSLVTLQPSSTNSTITGSILPRVRNKIAKQLSQSVPEAYTLHMQVVFRIRNPDQFARCAAAIADPSSAEYGHFLNATTLQPYLPTPGQKLSVVSFFTNKGFVVKQGASPLVMELSSSAKNVRQVLGAPIALFNDGNETFYASDADPVLPANLASLVQAILGLDNATRIRTSSAPASVNHPCVGPYCPQGLQIGYSFSSLYTSGYDGTGQKVAVVIGQDDSDPQSAMNTFSSEFGLSQTTLTILYPHGSSTPEQGFEGDLDVQSIHSVAPGAQIVLVHDNDFFSAIDYIATNHVAAIVSNSWVAGVTSDFCDTGFSSSSIQALDQRLAVDAAQGLTMLFASGDWSAKPDGVHFCTHFPASDPNVLAIGGTDLTLTGCGTFTCTGYGTEDGWSDSGGGYSGSFAEPSWQTSTIGTKPGRAVPDVSMLGGSPGIHVYHSQLGWGGWTGTSLSTPLWAGFLAIVLQMRNGHQFGNIAPWIFQIGSTSSYASEFHDITVGSNGYSAGSGWDPVTGWGTPIGSQLASALAKPTVSTDKTIYAQLEVIQFSGVRFTPGGSVQTCLSTDNDGSLLCVGQSNADGQGRVAGTMQVGTNIPAGPQKFMGKDISMGTYSDAIQLTITSSQLTMTVRYSVVGGGAGYSAPMFNYVQYGTSKAQVLTASPLGIKVDSDSSWSVTPNPLVGSSSLERWYSSQSLNGAALTTTIVFTFYHQYAQTLSYSVSEGSGYSAPSFAAKQNGASVAQTLTGSATGYWFDVGYSWSLTPNPLSGSGSSERWYSSQQLSGTVSATTIVFMFYHQYSETLSYSVSGGGSGYSVPTFTANRNGASTPQSLTTTATGYWFDGGSSWSATTNPLSGSGTSEQWITTQTTSGMLSSAQAIVFTYQHQYYLTTQVSPSGGGSVSVPSGWQNAGITVPITATPSTDYAFYYWGLDGTNVGNNPSLSVAMNSAHGLTAFFLGSSSISLGLSSGSIDLGSLVILSGAITPTQPAGMTVSLGYSLDGSAWNTFIVTRTDDSGSYSVAWCPPHPNTYQIKASWSGNANYVGSTSSASSLSVTGTPPPRVMLLVTGPPSAIRGSTTSFDVLVTNPGDSLVTTTLYIEVTGPGGYEYFDTLQVSVAAGSMRRFQFTWQPPSASGTYQVMVGLIPPRPTSIGQTQITVT